MNDLLIKMKGLLLSKTFWVGMGLALVTNVSSTVDAWVAAHPGTAGAIVAAVFGIVMRSLTTQSLAEKAAPKDTP